MEYNEARRLDSALLLASDDLALTHRLLLRRLELIISEHLGRMLRRLRVGSVGGVAESCPMSIGLGAGDGAVPSLGVGGGEVTGTRWKLSAIRSSSSLAQNVQSGIDDMETVTSSCTFPFGPLALALVWDRWCSANRALRRVATGAPKTSALQMLRAHLFCTQQPPQRTTAIRRPKVMNMPHSSWL